MSMASKITQLSATFPPIVTTFKPNTDPFISSRKNVLSIDLVENEGGSVPMQTSDELKWYPERVFREDLTSNSVRVELEMLKASQGPVHFNSEYDWSPEVLDRNTLLIQRIRKVVSEDAARQLEDKFDCVEIGPEPWPEHLRALDGLSPKHLQVSAGFEEQIDIIELDKLNTKFKPESLWITDVASDWGDQDWDPIPTNPSSEGSKVLTPGVLTPSHALFPEFFTHVTSLTLNYCCGHEFRGTNLPTHLRQLRIINNDAMGMFKFAVDNIPNASEQLEKVLIYTDPQFERSVDGFGERLGRCKGLRELTLIIAISSENGATGLYAPFGVGLSRSLPNSLERLEFHCSNSELMLADLDVWIEGAKDPEWLPRLKYIHICTYDAEMDKFRLGNKPSTVVVDPGRDRMFSEKLQRMYEVLKSRVPPVKAGLI